jgi:hypothetical protein
MTTNKKAGVATPAAKQNQHVKNNITDNKKPITTDFQNHNLFKNLILPENLDANYNELLNSSWRIRNILPDDARLTVIYGKPKSYKSFVALDMALSVATGIEYHGNKTERCNVLYIAAEGQKGITKRIKAWLQVRGVEKLENFYPFVKPITINDDKACKELISFLKLFPVKPELIFIDTLNRSMKGNENGDDMTAFVAGVTEISVEIGAQVVVIHHTPKNGEGMRGHSSLLGAVDFSYLVEKHKKLSNVAVLTRDEVKDHDDNGVMFFNMPVRNIVDVDGNNDTDADGNEISSLVPILNAELKPEPQQSASSKLRGIRLNVYNALKAAIDAAKGEPVTQKEWSQEYYRRDNSDNKYKNFSEQRSKLVKDCLVCESGGQYTITED